MAETTRIEELTLFTLELTLAVIVDARSRFLERSSSSLGSSSLLLYHCSGLFFLLKGAWL